MKNKLPALALAALAPAAFSAMLAFGLTRNGALSILAALAVLGATSYGLATRKRLARPRAG